MIEVGIKDLVLVLFQKLDSLHMRTVIEGLRLIQRNLVGRRNGRCHRKSECSKFEDRAHRVVVYPSAEVESARLKTTLGENKQEVSFFMIVKDQGCLRFFWCYALIKDQEIFYSFAQWYHNGI